MKQDNCLFFFLQNLSFKNKGCKGLKQKGLKKSKWNQIKGDLTPKWNIIVMVIKQSWGTIGYRKMGLNEKNWKETLLTRKAVVIYGWMICQPYRKLQFSGLSTIKQSSTNFNILKMFLMKEKSFKMLKQTQALTLQHVHRVEISLKYISKYAWNIILDLEV